MIQIMEINIAVINMSFAVSYETALSVTSVPYFVGTGDERRCMSQRRTKRMRIELRVQLSVTTGNTGSTTPVHISSV